MNLKVPIYFSSGLTIQANMYYKMLINWTSQKVKQTYASANAFDFKNVQAFDRSMINAPGPCVLFATPGMLTGGFSLEVFMQWAPCETNLVTLPGYCVAGTIGSKLMSGKPTKIDLDKNTQIDVRCQIHQLSFSAHTDSKGIMDLVKFLAPKHAILVHGEKHKMAALTERIQSELSIPCYYPKNNETVSVSSTHHLKAHASETFIQNCLSPNFKFSKSGFPGNSRLQVADERVADSILVAEKGKRAKVIHHSELLSILDEKEHEIKYAYCCPVCIKKTANTDVPLSDNRALLQLLSAKLADELSEGNIQHFEEQLQIESFCVLVCLKDECQHRVSSNQGNQSEFVFFCCNWSSADENLAYNVISIMESTKLDV